MVVFLLSTMVSKAIPYDFKEEIKWGDIQKFTIDGGIEIQRLSFEGAYYPSFEKVPTFIKDYPIHTANAKVSCTIENGIYEPLSAEEQLLLKDDTHKNTHIASECDIVVRRKQPFVQIRLQPLKWNVEKSVFEKLVSFTLVVDVEDQPERADDNRERINSVLSEGEWYKVKIDKSGIFKITYQELQEMGFNVSIS